MPLIDQQALQFLDGFLRGLSFMKANKDSFDLSATEFILAYQQERKSFFIELFKPELDIAEYSERDITKKDFFEKILNILRQISPIHTPETLILKAHFYLIEYIENVVVDVNGDSLLWGAWRQMHIRDISIKFSQGGTNRYFFFDLKYRSFVILVAKYEKGTPV